MQETSTRIYHKTKRVDSGELPRIFIFLILIPDIFIICRTANQLKNFFPQHDFNKGNFATGTSHLRSSYDKVNTSNYIIYGYKSKSVRFPAVEKTDTTINIKKTNTDVGTLELSKFTTSEQIFITPENSSSLKTGDKIITYGFPLANILGNAELKYPELNIISAKP